MIPHSLVEHRHACNRIQRNRVEHRHACSMIPHSLVEHRHACSMIPRNLVAQCRMKMMMTKHHHQGESLLRSDQPRLVVNRLLMTTKKMTMSQLNLKNA
jgi:hypothetical protein